MLNLLTNWRMMVWVGFHVVLIVGSFLPQTGELLVGWWNEQQNAGPVRWRVTRRITSRLGWWSRVRHACRWGRAVMLLSLSIWFLGNLLPRPVALIWIWLCLECFPVVISRVMVGAGRWVFQRLIDFKIIVSVAQPDSQDEVIIDLEPILAEIEGFSPIGEVHATAREALTAKFERVRVECFQHPVGQALMEQIDAEVQQVIIRTIEEALAQELNEHLGFERYERTGEAKPAHQHRSGNWDRSLRTLWSEGEVRVPKLRKGNKGRIWQVLERYERSFGPWLDVQLHLYRLGLSQRDLQEILHLGFGQVLSHKAVQHLTDVARREMEAFREAFLDDTPPVIIVDGVNIKVLLPTGLYRTNQCGQRRQEKRREDATQ